MKNKQLKLQKQILALFFTIALMVLTLQTPSLKSNLLVSADSSTTQIAGFETGETIATQSSTPFWITSSDKHTGEKSLRYDGKVKGSGTFYALLKKGDERITVEAGKEYELSFYYKVDNEPNEGATLNFYVATMSKDDISVDRTAQALETPIVINSVTDTAVDNGWVLATTKFVATFTNAESNALAIGVTASAKFGSYVEFDDISLTEDGTPMTTFGCEAGETTTSHNRLWYTGSNVHTGTQALYYDGINATGSCVVMFKKGDKRISVEAGKDYELSFYYKVKETIESSTSTATFEIYTAASDNSSATRTKQALGNTIEFTAVDNGWVLAKTTFTASCSSSENNAIAIGIYSASALGVGIYLDDFSLIEVEIPMTTIGFEAGETVSSSNQFWLTGTNVHSGTKSLCYSGSGSGSPSVMLQKGVKRINVENGKKYELSFYYKVKETLTSSTATAKFDVYTAASDNSSDTRTKQTLENTIEFTPVDNGWVLAKTAFVASCSSAENNAIAIGVTAPAVFGVSIYFDDFALTEVELPFADINCDYKVDIRDLVAFKKLLSAGTTIGEYADLDGDGKVDAIDLSVLRQVLLGCYENAT